MNSILKLVIGGLLIFQISAVAEDQLGEDGVQCDYLGTPNVVIFDEQAACLDGKPRSRFLCMATVRCTRPGFSPIIGPALCEMPADGCGAIRPLDCGKQKSASFSVNKMKDVNLDEARRYKREVQDEEKLNARTSGSSVKRAGINH